MKTPCCSSSEIVSDARIRGHVRRILLNNLTLAAAFGLTCWVAIHLSNAQLTILHSFADGTVPNDGAVPVGGLIQAPNGSFYGTTTKQASVTKSRTGTVFQMSSGGQLTIIHHFDPESDSAPKDSLLFYKGGLFYVCPKGIFRTSLEGDTVSPGFPFGRIYHLVGALIVGSDGDLHGALTEGAGGIYGREPQAPHDFTFLYLFSGSTGGNSPTAGLLLGQDGNYYGTTAFSSNSGLGGTIFQASPAGSVAFIYQFPSLTSPNAALIQDADGSFYGTAFDGGQYGSGIVFKMTTSFVVTTLHSFGNGPDGSAPSGLVLGPNGNLYGTTLTGGTANRGTVYELRTDGSSYSVLHNFADGSVSNDGITPNGPLVVGSDNNLYGTTQEGGPPVWGRCIESVLRAW